MRDKNSIIVQELAGQCVRAHRAELKLAQLHHMLDGLNLVLWHTDRELRLIGSYGLSIAEAYHDRSIAEFYRDAFGLDDADAEPLAAHRDAQGGQRVTVAWKFAGQQHAMLINPARNEHGRIVGTIGMSVPLAT